MTIEDLRKRWLRKLSDAVVRTRGLPGYIAANATFDALERGRDAAHQDPEHRKEAISFCLGVRRTLDSIRTMTHVPPYVAALDLAIVVLESKVGEHLDQHSDELRDVVSKLAGLSRLAA